MRPQLPQNTSSNTQLVDALKEKGEQREDDMIYRWKFNNRETSLHGKSDCTPQNSLQKLALVDAQKAGHCKVVYRNK